MKQTPRTLKLGESLREIVADILATEISDPRLHMVTVTGLQVSSDLGVANVYVTAHGDQERYEEVLEGLESARGRIRSLLGKQISLRTTPELRFFIDPSVDEGERIDQALQNVPPTLADTETDLD
jgi:ribosome-binding factor A